MRNFLQERFITTAVLQKTYLNWGILGSLILAFMLSSTASFGTTCHNVTDGGTIGQDQSICAGNSVTISNDVSPSGGSGDLEYLWLANINGPDVNGASSFQSSNASITTGALTHTVWYRRCARRDGCSSWNYGESNWIKITVNNAEFEHVDFENETSCDANDGKIITDPYIDQGTTLPYTVTYTYNGQSYTAGPYTHNQDNIITGLAPGVYSNILMTDAAGCTDSHGDITIAEYSCGTPPSNNCSSSIISWDLDACQAYSNASSFDEFTPTYNNNNCGNISATTVYRNNPSQYPHSCLVGQEGNALCISGTHVNYVPDNSVHTLRFSATLDAGTAVSGLSFYQKSEPHILNIGQSSTVANNYLKKYSVRARIDGNLVFESNGNHTSQSDWSLASFDFSSISAFDINSGTTIDFELVAYDPIENGASVRAWEIDEIKLLGCCTPPPPTNCSNISENIPGFIYLGEYNNSKYFCTQHTKTWNEAVNFVAANGGEIAIINDAGENAFLASGIMASEAWIGYTDENNEGTFSWYNGESSSYTNWSSSEPNNQDPHLFYYGGDYTVIKKSSGVWHDRNGQNSFEVIMEVKCGGTPDCSSKEIVKYDMDACYSYSSNNTNFDYSEFTPDYPNAASFTNVSATNVFRNAGAHSCIEGQSGSGRATCFGVGPLTSFQDNSDLAIRFEVTVNPSQTGHLTGLMFHEMAPNYYHHISGNSGTNNYPTKYGVRVTKNGNEIFKQIDINTTQAWSMESFDFSNDPDFKVTTTTTFKFELLSYDAVSIGGNLSAWDLDNIIIKGRGCVDGANIGDLVFNDINGNGIQDAGDIGIQGVTVMLLDENGAMVNQAVTDANGIYAFNDVAPGQYKLKYPATFTANGLTYNLTQANQGGDENLDSDAVAMAGTNDAMSDLFTIIGGEIINDIDAGYYAGSKFTGVAFEDADGDGVRAANDVLLEGITVMLLDDNGVMVAQTTTDANGVYEFDNLAPGSYKIKVGVDATDANGNTYDLTFDNIGGDEDLDSDPVRMNDGSGNAMTAIFDVEDGAIIDDQDLGYIPKGKIGDFVFEDTNANGVQDPADNPIQGAIVTLTGIDIFGDTITIADTTDAAGMYMFSDLAPGTYVLTFDANTPGFIATEKDAGANGVDALDSDINELGVTDPITLLPGENNETTDAGFLSANKIKGVVFEDPNTDGIREANDNLLEGITVMLLDDNGAMVDQTTTDANGAYEFDNLPSGIYKIKVGDNATDANGDTYVLTFSNVGGDDTVDSDAVRMNDGSGNAMTQPIALANGLTVENVDAGYIPTAKIGDFVFQDKNNNGVQDNGDEPIANATVTLVGTDFLGNAVSLDTTTNALGLYTFEDLAPGTYVLTFDANNPNFRPTDKNVGFNSEDSNINAAGTTDPITLAPGDNNETIDAGFVFANKIEGVVFEDPNADGVKDGNDDKLEGITVMLLDDNGAMVAQTTTDANGAYKFDNLAPGSYKVKVGQEVTDANGDTYVLTYSNVGGDDTADSDAVRMTDGSGNAMTQIVVLTDGATEVLDAGYIPTAKLGDFVFQDNNKNGIQDNTDDPIENVIVTLVGTDIFGNAVNADTTTNEFGLYTFEDLAPGTYVLTFNANNPDFAPTAKNVGFGGEDSNIDAAGTTDPITLNPGDDNQTIDAGFILGNKLRGIVFEDGDTDGLRNPTDNRLEGITVMLLDNTGTMVIQTTTGSNGVYEFDNLPAGDYKIKVGENVTDANGDTYVLTYANEGGDDTLDSDPDRMNDGSGNAMSQLVTLANGATVEGVDAGYVPTGKIGDFVFEDKNSNGLQDTDDTPIANATVTLFGTDIFGNSINGLISTTDALGKYAFEDLAPGDYYLTFNSNNATFIPTLQDELGNGFFDPVDSDINSAGRTNDFTLNPGENNETIDAGFIFDPSLPVELTTFEARLINSNQVSLVWSTSSEENNKHFVVERSLNGTDFSPIGVVAGQGTSNIVNNYTLEDLDPFFGNNYYRLKQVDYDGQFEYSHIEIVTVSGEELPDLIVYPNPVRSSTTLRVVTPFDNDTTIEIVNSTGVVMQRVVMAKGTNSKQINLNDYAAGMYFAYINYNGHRTLVYNIVKVDE